MNTITLALGEQKEEDIVLFDSLDLDSEQPRGLAVVDALQRFSFGTEEARDQLSANQKNKNGIRTTSSEITHGNIALVLKYTSTDFDVNVALAIKQNDTISTLDP